MRDLNICLAPNITMSAACKISYEDLAVVMGNLMDNAIAACEMIPFKDQRSLDLTIKQFQDYLCFKIEHPLPPSLREVEEEDPLYPRISLRTVSLLAEKYEGNVQTRRSDTTFSVTVLMINSMDPCSG